MNKNMFAVLMTLFIVFVGLQFAEPATAAKVVDHGTKYVWSGQDNAWMKITWTAYQYQYKKNCKINNNFLKIYRTGYIKNPKTKKYVYQSDDTFTLTKVGKNSVKITCKSKPDELGPGTSVEYRKTKLTAAQYYWRVFKHEITA